MTVFILIFRQLRQLYQDDPKKHAKLLDTISKIRDEEQEHRDIGIDNDAMATPFYSAFNKAVRCGCKMAIWLSERA